MPLGFLSVVFFIPSSTALKACTRGTSGAKKSLKPLCGFAVFGYLLNSQGWLSASGKEDRSAND
jgi:hypothetical protein